MKKLLLFIGILSISLTYGQLRLVKNINTLGTSSSPRDLFVFNNKLYFIGITGANSTAQTTYFVSDGTESGTDKMQVGSYNPRLYSNNPVNKIVHNGDLIFFALDYTPSNIQPWNKLLKIDGSTSVVSELVNLSSIYKPNDNSFGSPISFGNKIYFSPIQNGNPNPPNIETIQREPYMTDLTQAGTTYLKDIVPYTGVNNSASSDPGNFTVLGSSFFFTAKSTSNGIELWKSDGTESGTNLYLDINAGTADSSPNQLMAFNNALIFTAAHPTLGRELFKSNGSGSLNVIKDINTTGDGNPLNLTDINGVLYFSADNGTSGRELWKSNGFSTGTVMIKDINPSGDANPSRFKQFGSDIYFVADDGVNGLELWKTDGTSAGTVMVKDINPSGSSNPNYFTEHNGKLYFSADNGTNGIELWVSDGTDAGTVMIEINPSGSGLVSYLTIYNNELYFGANAGTPSTGAELYAYSDSSLSANDYNLNQNVISLYPNPSKSYFEMETTVILKKVEVYSMQGQLIKSFLPQKQYDISELISGIYLVKVHGNIGNVTKRLVKD